MTVFRVRSFDHRIGDPTDETVSCEYFASSRREALAWIRARVRDSLHIDNTREPDLFDPSAPSQEPVEVHVGEIEIADLSRLELTLACLNRVGWLSAERQTVVWFDKNGRQIIKRAKP